MEYTREIKVTIYRDTNKATYEEKMEPYEGESIDDFVERVKEKIDEMLLERE